MKIFSGLLEEIQHSFRRMTNVCNKCHQVTSHAFNVITVPDQFPVVNQDFPLPLQSNLSSRKNQLLCKGDFPATFLTLTMSF